MINLPKTNRHVCCVRSEQCESGSPPDCMDSSEQTESTNGPLDGITIRHHAAMPKWCKLNGLEIRDCPPSEGGGFMVRRDQAEAIISLLQLPGVNEHGN